LSSEAYGHATLVTFPTSVQPLAPQAALVLAQISYPSAPELACHVTVGVLETPVVPFEGEVLLKAPGAATAGVATPDASTPHAQANASAEPSRTATLGYATELATTLRRAELHNLGSIGPPTTAVALSDYRRVITVA